MPNEEGLYGRFGFYGLGNAGKTALAVSSFWDWRQGQQVANGRWITIGQEDNPALGVPEELRQLGAMSLRLSAPSLTEEKWLKDLESITTTLVKLARKGEYLDALVFDGLSEFNLLHEEVLQRGGVESFEKWDTLQRDLFGIMQRLDPRELHCNIFMTARVMERRKERQGNKGKALPGDPEFMRQYDYYPALRGSFRLNLPHYFNAMLYMETALRRVEGQRGQRPVHLLHMVQTGNFFIKSQWEHKWLQEGLPPILANPTWPDVWRLLVRAEQAAPRASAADSIAFEEESEGDDNGSK